jgi:hypothetical protein
MSIANEFKMILGLRDKLGVASPILPVETSFEQEELGSLPDEEPVLLLLSSVSSPSVLCFPHRISPSKLLELLELFQNSCNLSVLLALSLALFWSLHLRAFFATVLQSLLGVP